MVELTKEDLGLLVGVSVDISMILQASGKAYQVSPFMTMSNRILYSDRSKGIQIRTMVQFLSECIEDLE